MISILVYPLWFFLFLLGKTIITYAYDLRQNKFPNSKSSWEHWRHALILAIVDFILFLIVYFLIRCPTVVDAIIWKQAAFAAIIFSLTSIIWIYLLTGSSTLQLFTVIIGIGGVGLILIGLTNLAGTIFWGLDLAICYLQSIIPVLIGVIMVIVSSILFVINRRKIGI